MDKLTSMAVFKRAVEAGSFAAAARHFGSRRRWPAITCARWKRVLGSGS
jgi:DNA-binding transcriptional LysR family regulator